MLWKLLGTTDCRIDLVPLSSWETDFSGIGWRLGSTAFYAAIFASCACIVFNLSSDVSDTSVNVRLLPRQLAFTSYFYYSSELRLTNTVLLLSQVNRAGGPIYRYEPERSSSGAYLLSICDLFDLICLIRIVKLI